MPHFCSRNLDVNVGHALHSKRCILHYELSILSLPKNGKITAARSICVYHMGNKALWAVSSPGELSMFQSQAFPHPGSESQGLPEYINLLRGRLTATQPPKQNARLFTDNEKCLSQKQKHIYCITSPFPPSWSNYRGSQIIKKYSGQNAILFIYNQKKKQDTKSPCNRSISVGRTIEEVR